MTCDKSWEFGDCRLSESEVSVFFGPGFIEVVQLRWFINNGTEVQVVHTNMYESHRRVLVQISYKNRVGAFNNH